ncbi:hypothetical protein T06_245 [Trichinella sp. T6]|nr:hypothetical protein T06_245 [Trichinella sp. T6]
MDPMLWIPWRYHSVLVPTGIVALSACIYVAWHMAMSIINVVLEKWIIQVGVRTCNVMSVVDLRITKDITKLGDEKGVHVSREGTKEVNWKNRKILKRSRSIQEDSIQVSLESTEDEYTGKSDMQVQDMEGVHR